MADYIRFSERQPQNSSSLPNSVECKAWICLNNFKNRLDSILNGCKNMEKNFNITNGTGTSGTGGKTIINTIIDSIFDKLNEQFKCLKIAAHNDDNDNDNDDDVGDDNDKDHDDESLKTTNFL